MGIKLSGQIEDGLQQKTTLKTVRRRSIKPPLIHPSLISRPDYYDWTGLTHDDKNYSFSASILGNRTLGKLNPIITLSVFELAVWIVSSVYSN